MLKTFSVKKPNLTKKYKRLSFIRARLDRPQQARRATKPDTIRLTSCVPCLSLATKPSSGTAQAVVLVKSGCNLIKMVRVRYDPICKYNRMQPMH
jgi:hypothetical protein